MDKSTLSNYGWVVIAVLVLSVMIALATPFGNFVSGAVQSTVNGLSDTLGLALNIDVGRLSVSNSTNTKTPSNDVHDGNIPAGGTYFLADTSENLTGETITEGKEFPVDPQIGDEYTYGDYVYKYGYRGTAGTKRWLKLEGLKGWGCIVSDLTKTTYGSPLASIGNSPVTSMAAAFAKCENLEYLPDDFKIPETCKTIQQMFHNCSALTKLPSTFIIPDSVTIAQNIFRNCTSLERIPDNFKLPADPDYLSGFFADCTSLKYLPNNFEITGDCVSVTNFFEGCTALEYLPDNFKLPEKIYDCSYMFDGCTSLKTLPTNFKLPSEYLNIEGKLEGMFRDCTSLNLPANFFKINKSNTTLSYDGSYLNVTSMFENCTSLTSCPFEDIDDIFQDSDFLFKGCTNLTGDIYISGDIIADGLVAETTKPITIHYAYEDVKTQITMSCTNTNITFQAM